MSHFRQLSQKVSLRNPNYGVLIDLMNGKKAHAKNGNENEFEKRKYKNGNENTHKNDEKTKRKYNSIKENINKNENIIQNEYNIVFLWFLNTMMGTLGTNELLL